MSEESKQQHLAVAGVPELPVIDPPVLVAAAALAHLLAAHRGSAARASAAREASDDDTPPHGAVVPPPLPPMVLHMAFEDATVPLLAAVAPKVRAWLRSPCQHSRYLTCPLTIADDVWRELASTAAPAAAEAVSCSLARTRKCVAVVVGRVLFNAAGVAGCDVVQSALPLLHPDVSEWAVAGAAAACLRALAGFAANVTGTQMAGLVACVLRDDAPHASRMAEGLLVRVRTDAGRRALCECRALETIGQAVRGAPRLLVVYAVLLLRTPCADFTSADVGAALHILLQPLPADAATTGVVEALSFLRRKVSPLILAKAVAEDDCRGLLEPFSNGGDGGSASMASNHAEIAAEVRLLRACAMHDGRAKNAA